MEDRVRKYLYDMEEAIESIGQYLTDKNTFSAYRQDKQLRRAVERELEIIGEAASKVLQIDPEIKIDDVRKIVDLRNWVIHGYDKVDDVVVWGILMNHLPRLKQQIINLL